MLGNAKARKKAAVSSEDEEATPRKVQKKMERPLQKGSSVLLPHSGRRLILGDQLGKGVYGEVFQASFEGSSQGEKLCLKIQTYNRDTRIQIQEEIRVMDVIKSNPAAGGHLMTHLCPITVPGYMCLLMPEFGTSLLNILNRKTGPFELSLLQEIGYQMLSGLQYLHALGYAHCDIKPSNILVKAENGAIAVKVADLGNATPLRQMNKWRYQNCVHATWYRPPEVYLGMQQDNKTDIWAAACILAEMYTGDALFMTEDHCHSLARQHFYLTGIPYAADREGKYFWKFYRQDQATGRLRPYSNEELLSMGICCRSAPVREYTYLEQMVQFGKNGTTTPMDKAFILTLKSMFQPNISVRVDATKCLRTPFFYAMMMRRIYGHVII